MPYLVALEVKESPVGGSGLFAMQDIPAGTKTWAMRPKGDDVAKVGRLSVPSRHSAWMDALRRTLSMRALWPCCAID